MRLIPSVNWISKYDFKSFIERLVFLDMFSIVSFISSSTYSGCFLSKMVKNKMEDNISPLLDTILNQVDAFKGNEEDDLQLQISSLDYDDYIGRLGIGRINKGMIKSGETVTLINNEGVECTFRISKLFVNEGIERVEKKEAYYGDIVTIAGCSNISSKSTYIFSVALVNDLALICACMVKSLRKYCSKVVVPEAFVFISFTALLLFIKCGHNVVIESADP